MPSLAELSGQPHVVQRLRAAIAHERLHHAYLLTCAVPAVSRATAMALAAAVNCLRAPGEGCQAGADDACDACAKIDAGIHPDVITLEREGAARLVPIETIRTQVVARGGLAPNEARTRVFVFDEATALAGPAANALLKTLEEPPRRTLFVLSTVAPEQLLPTIRSRCQRIAFAPVAAEDVAADGDPAAAARLAELAAEIAWFEPRHGAIDVASRLAAGKGEVPVLVAAAAGVLHRAARAAVFAAHSDEARALTERAEVLGRWQIALSIHNAHPQLALETLLGELGGIAVGGAEVRA
ncbi:MAG: hypothetical protein R2939_13345 [Kofleriaceae bacterium]